MARSILAPTSAQGKLYARRKPNNLNTQLPWLLIMEGLSRSSLTRTTRIEQPAGFPDVWQTLSPRASYSVLRQGVSKRILRRTLSMIVEAKPPRSPLTNKLSS